MVGVGKACEEPEEWRLLALANGTKMPDIGWVVVK